jgi:hypothetical protein
MIRNMIERAMLATSRMSVDVAIKESTALIARLKRTQAALNARAARYEALADRYDNRAVADRSHSDRAAKVIAKLEDIFG